MAQPELMAMTLAKYLIKFNAADVNSNRMLSEKEYTVFFKSLNEAAAADGKFVDRRTHAPKEEYDAFNLISPDSDGVTYADFGKGAGVMVAKMGMLKTEYEAKHMASKIVAEGSDMANGMVADGTKKATGMMMQAGVIAAVETEYDEEEVEINGHIMIIKHKRDKLEK